MESFFAQPWLAEEIVKDVRVENNIRNCDIELKKIMCDLDNLRVTMKSGEENINEIQEKIDTIQEELRIRNEIPKDNNTEAENEVVKRIQDILGDELKTQMSEHFLSSQLQQRATAMEIPIVQKYDKIIQQKLDFINDLKKRKEDRRLIAKVFFDNELFFCTQTLPTVSAIREGFNLKKEEAKKRLTLLKLTYEDDESVRTIDESVRTGTVTVTQCDLIKIPMIKSKNDFNILEILLTVYPHTGCHSIEWLERWMKSQELLILADIRVYEQIEEGINNEYNLLNTFNIDRENYENTARLWEESLLKLRRQKVIQNDLDERKNKLENLRNIKKKEEDEKLKLMEEEEKESKIVSDTVTTKVAKRLRKVIRSTKDVISNYRNNIGKTIYGTVICVYYE